MSRSLRKPSVTPRTALATRLRARPWNLPRSGSSRSVRAVRWSPSTAKPMPAGSIWRSVPFGPCTPTTPGWTSTLTPFGITMGFLPMRDICQLPVSSFQLPVSSFQRGAWSRELEAGNSPSPHVTQDFAADAGLDRLAAGHDAARGRQDARAEPGQHVRHVVAAEVHAAPGAAHPLDARDHALAARAVLQEQAELRLGAFARLRLEDLEALHVAFALEN